MPLTPKERQLLKRIEHLKIYLLVLAGAVFVYLLFVPADELKMATSIVGVALCGVFWLTQRLLLFISLLDLELTRIMNVLKRTLPAEQRKELFGEP